MSCEYFIKEYPYCCDLSKNQIINAKESGRTYSLSNKSKKLICKIKIDDCVIKLDNDKKCDYLFLICPESQESIHDTIAFFVELKGQDLIRAIRQITNCITIISQKISNCRIINARIVLSKVNSPDIRGTELIRFKKLIKKLGGDVRYDTVTMTEII